MKSPLERVPDRPSHAQEIRSFDTIEGVLSQTGFSAGPIPVQMET